MNSSMTHPEVCTAEPTLLCTFYRMLRMTPKLTPVSAQRNRPYCARIVSLTISSTQFQLVSGTNQLRLWYQGRKSLLDDTYIEYYAKNAYYYFLQVHPPSRHC